MIHGFLLAIGTLRAVFLSEADLVFENLALRQQLAVFARNGQRPRIVAADRLFWACPAAAWLRWSDVVVGQSSIQRLVTDELPDRRRR